VQIPLGSCLVKVTSLVRESQVRFLAQGLTAEGKQMKKYVVTADQLIDLLNFGRIPPDDFDVRPNSCRDRDSGCERCEQEAAETAARYGLEELK